MAIKLGLKEPEVHELYRQYWKLQQLYTLCKVYENVKDDIWSFVELYRLTKVVGMDHKHVKKLLEIANNDLPMVQARYEGLRIEVDLLESERVLRNKYLIYMLLWFIFMSYREALSQIDTLHQERFGLKES